MPFQFETINLVAVGSARFDGAAAVVDIPAAVGAAPNWTDAANAAAWKALFNKPTQASMSLAYVSHVDIYIEGADGFVTRVSGGVPTAANGYKWVQGREETLRNCAQMLRDMRFYLPAGASMYVTVYSGSL